MNRGALWPVAILGVFALTAQAILYPSRHLVADASGMATLAFLAAVLVGAAVGALTGWRWRRPPPLAWLAGLLPVAFWVQDHFLLGGFVAKAVEHVAAALPPPPVHTALVAMLGFAPVAVVSGLLVAIACRQCRPPEAGGRGWRFDSDHLAPLLGCMAGALVLHAFLLARLGEEPQAEAAPKSPDTVDVAGQGGGVDWEQVHPALSELARKHRDGGWLRKEGEAGGTSFTYLLHEEAKAYAFLTARLAPKVEGFVGPMTLAVLADGEGRLLDVVIAESGDTPDFLRMLDAWRASLKGKAISTVGGLDGIDTVSGATYSSRAVLTLLRHSGPAFSEAVLEIESVSTSEPPSTEAPGQADQADAASLEWPVIALILAMPVVLLLRRYPSRRRRLAFLAAVVLLFGILWNAQISTVQAMPFLAGEWPSMGWTLPFALAVAVPLGVMIFGNLYCGWLCPFGALQEWAAAVRPASWRIVPGAGALRIGRFVKYGLLLALLALAAWRPQLDASRIDLLVHAFSPTRTLAIGAALLVVLALSLFVPRFWCRFLCPTGAFLGLLGGFSPLRRKPPVVPGRCDLGVRTSRDYDCILCDRCRQESD